MPVLYLQDVNHNRLDNSPTRWSSPVQPNVTEHTFLILALKSLGQQSKTYEYSLCLQ